MGIYSLQSKGTVAAFFSVYMVGIAFAALIFFKNAVFVQ
jgi:hypothetical protein